MTATLQHADATNDPFDFVAPDSLLARSAGLWGYVPANGAAFLLQVMHPTIGDVVGEYSTYGTDPFGRAIRSIDSVNLWVYGEASAVEEGQRLRRLHQPLQMVNSDGERISALNPQPYGWVIATGFATTVWMWPRMFGHELAAADERQLFAEFQQVARIVQIPDSHFPATQADFWPYFNDMVSTTLVNHPVAQDIIRNQLLGAVPRPPMVPRALAPAWYPAGVGIGRVTYLITMSLLPRDVRRTLEIDWTSADSLAAKALWTSLRLSTRYLPDRIKYTPLAYHSIRRAQTIAAIKHRALSSFV
jgi:uncharacterized protein (DUF2236 family)